MLLTCCKSTLSAFVLALSLTLAVHAQNKPEGWQTLVELYYKLEVTHYCSLASDAVISGFQKANTRLLKQNKFSQEQLNAIRGEAWAAGYREWDNRGLGGFRKWCANEGMRYAREFVVIARE